MQFTNEGFATFREDLEKAIRPVEEKHALRISKGDIRYDEDKFTVKLECVKTDAGDIEKKEFEKYCSVFGLSSDDYMREFVTNGTKYALVGLSPNCPKYPYNCVNVRTKKTYKFAAEAINKAFGK